MVSRDSTPPPLITAAAQGRSADASRRQRNYLIMMGIRVLCFVGLLFAPGNTKWFLLAGAVVLPYVAVLVVNQGDQRSHRPAELVEPGPPVPDAPERVAVEAVPELIEGEVVPDETPPRPALGSGEDRR
ncbi:DUF3099 domain-containing protein [Auraticoccus sp. F435]|uniref:DUF3099 domain-containing protein n=1 Tax=Auraticoccus cholistanensis TaxID=2656650 RepID=A0A6A9UZ49_9ACTN|nr:DUF3099 domain-containing protein [Auraticoccus cholistanensis]